MPKWIFVINLPLVVGCLRLITRRFPAAPPALRRRIDVVDAALAARCSR